MVRRFPLFLTSSIFVCGCLSLLAGYAAEAATVHIYVFMSPDCTYCEPVHAENIQALAKKAACTAEIKYFDIDKLEDYQRLCDLEKKYGKTGNEMPVVFVGSDVFGGEKEARAKLYSVLMKYSKEGTLWPDDVVFKTESKANSSDGSSTATGQPVTEFDKTEINLGDLDAGRVAKAVFTLKNSGSSDLVLDSVRSACGCFDLKIESRTIKPNTTCKIEVDFHTEGLHGNFNKSIMVDGNDPLHRTTRLSVKAKIIPIAILSPERLNFGTISAGQALEKSILVTPMKPEAFSVVDVSSDGSRLGHFRIEKADDGKGSYRVLLTINAGEKPGRVLEKIRIRAYSHDGPIVPFTLFGNIADGVGK